MKRKLQFYIIQILVLFLAIGFYSFKHPFYLSVVDLKYNNKEQLMQGSIKVFVNDFEDALTKLKGKRVDLIHPSDKKYTEKLISDYLLKRFYIQLEKKQLNYTIIGYEIEQEATWVYIETETCANPKKIEIENSILYDFLKGQANIIHIEVNGETKSSKVNCPDKNVIFEF